MKLDDDDFAVFGLPRRFALDRTQLDARWKALQAQVHPDRYAVDGAAAQRLAVQWAARVNQAYQVLKDPLRRAAVLAGFHGQELHAESNTTMPQSFLHAQMVWREKLDEAADAVAVETLRGEVQSRLEADHAELARSIDETDPVDWPAVAQRIRALMFTDKFLLDVERAAERMQA